MVCKLMKKGLITAALGAGALALLFGTSAPSYVKTAFHKVRQNAKAMVPIQIEIDRARQQVADLEPAIKDSIENFARAEEDVKELKADIATTEQNQTKEAKEIAALSHSLKTGDFHLASGVSYTPDEVKVALARRFDSWKQIKRTLDAKYKTLKAKEQSVGAAREMLNTIQAERRALMTKIDEIEARNKSIEATQARNDYHFDETPLAEVKKTISELERRVNVKARAAEIEGRFAEPALPAVTEQSTSDLLKEIDNEMGNTGSTETPRPTKSL